MVLKRQSISKIFDSTRGQKLCPKNQRRQKQGGRKNDMVEAFLSPPRNNANAATGDSTTQLSLPNMSIFYQSGRTWREMRLEHSDSKHDDLSKSPTHSSTPGRGEWSSSWAGRSQRQDGKKLCYSNANACRNFIAAEPSLHCLALFNRHQPASKDTGHIASTDLCNAYVKRHGCGL